MDECKRVNSEQRLLAEEEARKLREELSKLRQLSEERAKQHEVDLTTQNQRLEILSQMERLRESQSLQEKAATQKIIEGLQKSAEQSMRR